MEQMITIPQPIINDMFALAEEAKPRECCGLLGGREDVILSYYPLKNKSQLPEKRYFAAPEDLFKAMREMRAADEKMIAIYHSHPNGPAYPSEVDIELAFYPDAFYLIITIEPNREIKAFRIVDGEVKEAKILRERETREINERR